MPGPFGVLFWDGPCRGLKVKACGNSCIHSRLPFVPLTRMRKTIFHTCGGLRHPKISAGAVFKSKQSPAISHARACPGTIFPISAADFIHFKSSNEASQIMRVRSDIAHHQRWTAANWVIFPRKHSGYRFLFICFATLNIFNLNNRIVPSCPSATIAFA